MNHTTPNLSIGLPVFNGENYLGEALDSLLGQTYSDFELIISDNASTDRTESICQAYAARDRRIRYYRNQENIGATQNWYRTFDLSSSEYFASAAHDDIYAPEYMQKCIAVLDQNPLAVLCHSKTTVIDENGTIVRNFNVEVDTTSPKPDERLYNMIGIDYFCIQMYGVMKASALRNTHVYIGYYGCDRNTLADLCLLGQIYEVPEYLFFHRIYPQALGAGLDSGRSLQELLLLDPGTNWRSPFPVLTRWRNYFAAVARAQLSRSERLSCYMQLVRLLGGKTAKWIRHVWKTLRN